VITVGELKDLSYYIDWAAAAGVGGRWWTHDQGAFGVGSGGAVTAERLEAFAKGEGARRRLDRSAGLDLTFSAPKSVSLMVFGHPDPATRSAMRTAHETAVTAALAWLEEQAVRSRSLVDGKTQWRPVSGIYAMFDHHTSRARNPQLHTHVLALNLAVDADGNRVAVDRALVKKYVPAVASVYRLVMRAEVAKLGFGFGEPGRSGLAELAGMPQHISKRYSKRHEEIAQWLGDNPTPAQKRSAAVRTREKKANLHDAAEVEDVGERLRSDLEQAGEYDAVFGHLQAPDAPFEVTASSAKAVLNTLLSDGGALSQLASWDKIDLVKALASVIPQGITAAQVDDLVAHITADEDLVPLVHVRETGDVATNAQGTETLRLAVANSRDLEVPRTIGLRWTSKDLLGKEYALLMAATWAWPMSKREADAVEFVLERTRRGGGIILSAEQEDLVRHFVCTPRAVVLGVGLPGSGKTTAVKACVEAWQELGVPIVALSFKGKSAEELKAAANVTSQTIDSLLKAQDMGNLQVKQGSVLVVDEASECSTERLWRLSEIARITRSRLVLLGDDRQRGSIEAGGMFATLIRQVGAVALTANVRQKIDYERRAVGLLRKGHSEMAFAEWRRNGHFRATEHYEDLFTLCVERWWQDRIEYPASVMLAQRHADVAALNALARQALIEAGQLPAEPLITVGTPENNNVREYAKGDRIALGKNDKSLVIRSPGGDVGSVKNGMVGTVAGYDLTQEMLLVDTDTGRVAVPREYVDKHTMHGYAVTVAKSQSSTIHGKVQIFRPETLSAEDFLVAASRATQGTYFNFLAQPGGAGGMNNPASEYEADDPQRYIDAMVDSLAWRLDHQSVGVAASSELITQAQAKEIANLLGVEGCLAYKAMWGRYATGHSSYTSEDAEKARLRVDVAKGRLAQIMAEARDGDADERDVQGAEANLAVVAGMRLVYEDYERATRSGIVPDRRYALEQERRAELAYNYAQHFDKPDLAAHPGSDNTGEVLFGVAGHKAGTWGAPSGVLDTQDLAGKDAVIPFAVSVDAPQIPVVPGPHDEVLAPLYAALDISQTTEPGAILAALAGESGEAAVARENASKLLGPAWVEILSAWQRQLDLAKTHEVAGRPAVPALVSHDAKWRTRVHPHPAASAKGHDLPQQVASH